MIAESQEVLAITIGAGEKHGYLAQRAAESCQRQTGLDVRILGSEALLKHNLKKPHHLKFRLFQEFPQARTILYFDADTIFLKEFDISRFVGIPEFVCVRDVWDRSWIYEDAARIQLPPKEYFNSGFFVVNRDYHESLLETAESLLGKVISQYKDQTVLNAARARLNIPAIYLSKYHNYLAFENCAETEQVVIGHLNGIHGRPKETIDRYYQFWHRNRLPDSEQRRQAMAEIGGKNFVYTRVGYDTRTMEFRRDGTIGRGGGRRERRWDVSDMGGELILWLYGDHQPICGLSKNGSGVWEGRWMRYEQMPIQVQPM